MRARSCPTSITRSRPGLGKIGVLVALESAAASEILLTLGKQIAMHVAAAHPLALRADDLPAELIERERSIALEKAKESGKPQNIVDKMVEGGLAKFRKENALLTQLFVIDNKTPIAEVVAAAANEAGTAITWPASFASRSAKASRRRKAISPPRWPRPREQQARTGRLNGLSSWQRGGSAIKAGPPLLHLKDNSSNMTRPRFNRILLKLSGEALMGQGQFGIDPDAVAGLAGEIANAKGQGHELCLVVGGGNIFRGMAAAAKGFDRATADYMGMLATVMNALALQMALEKIGVDTRVLSAIPMSSVSEPYIRRRALRHLEKGRIVLFAAGTGNPYFTTDTAAALRAAEMGCDALFKGTSVDGVYTADPKQVADATRYDTLTYNKVLGDDLKVMDAAAVALCRDNNIPIVVFNIRQPGNLAEVIEGRGTATIVQDGE